MADFGFMRIVDFKMIGSFVNVRIWCDLLLDSKMCGLYLVSYFWVFYREH